MRRTNGVRRFHEAIASVWSRCEVSADSMRTRQKSPHLFHRRPVLVG
jgi:hypothetical protein